MLKFFKIALAIILLGSINIENVFAEGYDVEGYISFIDTIPNNKNCMIGISKTPNGPIFKSGVWSCDSFDGQIMFELAEDAMFQFFPMVITFVNETALGIIAIEAKQL